MKLIQLLSLLFLIKVIASASLTNGVLSSSALRYILGYGPFINELILNYENINSIDANTFVGFDDLNTLNLAHNNIRAIDTNTIAILRNLFTIDLSYNQIETINENITFN